MITVLTSEAMRLALGRIAHQILERKGQQEDLVLVGLQTRGVFLARRLASKIEEYLHRTIPTGSLDISMYRDDLSRRSMPPTVKQTEIPCNLDEKTVILVDDVLFTGRTIRAAMDALADYGRPHRVQLAVLVDRGNRELPIQPDYVGKQISTTLDQQIRVRMMEEDQLDEVSLEKTTPGA